MASQYALEVQAHFDPAGLMVAHDLPMSLISGGFGGLLMCAKCVVRIACRVLMTALACSSAWSQTDLSNATLEELMNVKVTSAAKKETRLSQTPAAIFVVTSDDIRRGGFTSIPEVLRMVPGLYVARISAGWWTVSARGFSDYLNNKMLVLVDGRNVYNPEFGGVDWDQQQIPMEDIDRIEVIRGPGGTLWGANAINGVINIVTKSARQTQGSSVVLTVSPEEGSSASVRYGAKSRRGLAYRIYEKSEYWKPGLTAAGGGAFDAWHLSQVGGRLDWDVSTHATLSIEGRGYYGRMRNEVPYFGAPGAPQSLLQERFSSPGGDVLVRWHRTLSDRSSTDLLGYCDWTDRQSMFEEARNTCDLELQHNYQLSARHSLIWGGSFLTTGSNKPGFFTVYFTPAQRRDNLASAFAQYEFDVVPDRFSVIAGSKLEHNPYTGFEVEPQIRAVWTPAASFMAWGAVSRGVRVPSEFEYDSTFELGMIPGKLPTYLAVIGNPNLKAETMKAYEAGYRFQPSPVFALDAAVFYNRYENLDNVDLVHIGMAGAPIVHLDPMFVEIPAPWQNLGPGQTHGVEVYATVKPISRWQLTAGITEVRGNSVNLRDSLNLPVANTPRHQFNVQSRLDLTHHWTFDSALYYYGGIPLHRELVLAQNVPAHSRVDVGMSWHDFHGFTFFVWGRDLGTASRPETLPTLFTITGSYVQRSVDFGVSWQSGPGR